MEVEQARLLQPAIRRFHRSVHDLRPLMTRRTRQPVLRLWAFQPILPRVQLRHIPLGERQPRSHCQHGPTVSTV